MIKIFAAVLAISAIAAPAFAGEVSAGSSSPPAAKPSSKPDPNQVICRQTDTLGSHISKSLCLTRQQWLARAESDSDDDGDGPTPQLMKSDLQGSTTQHAH